MRTRDRILKKLRQAQPALDERRKIETRRHMVPLQNLSADERVEQFVTEAEKLGCHVYRMNQNHAIEQMMELIGANRSILSWDEDQLPMPSLHETLGALGVTVGQYDDSELRVGLTGAGAALAATGSLVLESGAGRYRTTSLLPDVHIALLRPEQILPDLESWQQVQKAQGYPAFTQSSNTTIVTGPSKTADIAQELIKGAHGPRELHIIILESRPRPSVSAAP